MTTQPRCSIARTLEFLRDRWTFLILREAHLGTTRFADFRDYLGIAPNILTNHLNDLVDAGLLEKREYRERGERTRSSYHLTPAGEDLKLVLAALQQWGDVHVPREEGPTVLRHAKPTGELVNVTFTTESGTQVPPEDVSFDPAPNLSTTRPAWR
jgi:DNA-binding HxlR family transcriptional regulator